MKRLLVPGWGYPSSWWTKVSSIEAETLSWGYFEEPLLPLRSFYDQIVVHSFGLYKLPLDLLYQAKTIVWYGAFFSALPFIENTLTAYHVHPEVVRQKFYKRMFYPHRPIFPACEANELFLFRDLELLASFDYAAFWQTNSSLQKTLICVSGEKDLIASPLAIQTEKKGSILFGQGHMPEEEGPWEECLRRLIHT